MFSIIFLFTLKIFLNSPQPQRHSIQKHFSITTFSIRARDATPCDVKHIIAKLPNYHHLNLPGMQTSSFISQLCEQTGISKRSLARLAGTHQSMIVRYSAGTHGLPAKAFEPLLQLQQQLHNSTPAAPPRPNADDIQDLQQQASWCLAQCHPLRKKLAAMQQGYTQGATALQLLDAHYNTELNNPKQQRWVEQQRYEANKKMEQNGWAAQFKLSTAIALLEQEAEMFTAGVNAAKGNLEN